MVRGIALDWFKRYLLNRKQFVQYNDAKSNTTTMPCGVPQGSVLGPLLFIIYTNDLPNCLLRCKAIIFADDTTVYTSSPDIKTLYKYANADLESLADWFQANKLSLNVGKTNYILFSQNKNLMSENLNLMIGKEIIVQKDSMKFLGLYVDSRLDWHEHINYIKNKLSSSLYAIRKVKHILNKNHLLTLYYSLTYPYMDYGNSLWDPHM